jgi:hypothetical protein
VPVNIRDLRTRLDEVTKTKENRNSQPDLVAAIPGCTVRAVAEDDARLPKAETYNCFMYALALADSEDYAILTAQFRLTPQLTTFGADARFMRHLIQDRLLNEIPHECAVTNDIVVYSDNADLQHAGKLFGLRVVSKWGDGLLWEHAIHEVPGIYGDSVAFYRHLSRKAAESAFANYTAITRELDPIQVQRLLEQRRSRLGATSRAGTANT